MVTKAIRAFDCDAFKELNKTIKDVIEEYLVAQTTMTSGIVPLYELTLRRAGDLDNANLDESQKFMRNCFSDLGNAWRVLNMCATCQHPKLWITDIAVVLFSLINTYESFSVVTKRAIQTLYSSNVYDVTGWYGRLAALVLPTIFKNILGEIKATGHINTVPKRIAEIVSESELDLRLPRVADVIKFLEEVLAMLSLLIESHNEEAGLYERIIKTYLVECLTPIAIKTCNKTLKDTEWDPLQIKRLKYEADILSVRILKIAPNVENDLNLFILACLPPIDLE